MALLDFLKNKKDAEKSKKPVKKEPAKALVAKEAAVEEKKSVVVKQEVVSNTFSFSVIREPHISEKGTYLAEDGKYVFRVYQNTNKPEIKKSIEGIYGVNVMSVNIIKIPAKKRRLGKTEGFKKGYAKAIVTLKEGQKIEIF